MLWCAQENKGYVGQTCWFVQRMSKHRNGDATNRWFSREIKDAIERLGWDAIKVEKLWEGEDENMLNSLEKKFIAEKGTLYPNGYNVHAGGGAVASRAKRKQKMQDDGSFDVLTQPKGPRDAALNQKQMKTWEAKREAKWEAAGLSESQKAKMRHNCAMEAASKKRKGLGLARNDESIGPEYKRKNYWKGAHAKRLGA
tara:strand:+ start:77 stop:670 length:594 start_codon:yes stop_codon:yes gene_type:complete